MCWVMLEVWDQKACPRLAHWDLGMDGNPFSLQHRWRPPWSDWRKSRSAGKTLFWRDPSANMASSGETNGNYQDKTRWVEFGFKTAFLYLCHPWQQHIGVVEDQDSTADLWLQRMSTTACLTNMVLNDGTWHGTWCSDTRRCHCRRKRRKEFAKSGLNAQGVRSAEAFGGGLPFHHACDGVLIFS